ncbi:hypothetical protein BDP27DRAFT_1370882 [Rhodocollybia butyracea]|uniref:Uncharacterized protein n=1 Tax=Rhodocollybia butyracea TaxID=206335 RepID=A0A9P5PDE8_9AGAR|nr:hypothetical protein BDP27DRAFT_1370882 [Rhodocollybia butyracea]
MGLPVNDSVPRPMRTRIAKFVFDMGEKLGDGKGRSREKNIKYQNPPESLKSQKDFDTLEMLYIGLEGGTFCSKKCYGYIVSPDKNYDDVLGALITQDDEGQYAMIYKSILPSRIKKKKGSSPNAYELVWEDRCLKFLTGFVLIKDWVVAMASNEGTDKVIIKAAKAIESAEEEADNAAAQVLGSLRFASS